VHGHARDVVSPKFDLTRVKPRTHLDAEGRKGIPKSARAADPPAGTIECGHESIAGGVHLPSTESLQLASYSLIMTVEEVLPALIAEFCSASSRANDVGEHYGGEDSIRCWGGARTCQELLDLIDDRISVTKEWDVVYPFQLDELGVGDQFGDRLTLPGLDHPVPTAVQDESGSLNVREDMTHIKGAKDLLKLPPRAG